MSAIADALSYFRANLATLIPEIFSDENATNQAAIQAWWGNGANVCPVQVGYTLQGVVAPQVAVTIEEEQELQQFAGGEHAGAYASVGSDMAEVDAVYMQTTYSCHCVGPNQDFVLWLQMLVKWALLWQRKALMVGKQQNGATTGVFERQKIAAGPFRPVPDPVYRESVFPFERVIMLQATHIDTWSGSAAPPMSSSSSVSTRNTAP